MPGNLVRCSMNGSDHAAFLATYQFSDCHDPHDAYILVILPPSGSIATTPETVRRIDLMIAGPLALSSISTTDDLYCIRWRFASFSVAGASKCRVTISRM